MKKKIYYNKIIKFIKIKFNKKLQKKKKKFKK